MSRRQQSSTPRRGCISMILKQKNPCYGNNIKKKTIAGHNEANIATIRQCFKPSNDASKTKLGGKAKPVSMAQKRPKCHLKLITGQLKF